ncbi:hypothetical protein C2E23DRAFT_687625, partial [Lenzites betulinus]
MHSGETGQRLGQLPLVLGMPVIVCQNFDVSGGIVNGSIGTLTKIRYKVDNITGQRILTSCVVKLPDNEHERAMESLNNHEFPILDDTV